MIQNLNDLKKLFLLCRKQGVTEIDLNGIKVKFGDMPIEKAAGQAEETDNDDPWKGFPDGILSNEQLAFYSAGGTPEDDPENGADQ